MVAEPENLGNCLDIYNYLLHSFSSVEIFQFSKEEVTKIKDNLDTSVAICYYAMKKKYKYTDKGET